MPIRERRVEMDLTAAERRYVDREDQREDRVRRYVEQNVCPLGDLGLRTMSRRKLAAGLRADREALQEALTHAVVSAGVDSLADFQQRAEAAEAEVEALRRQLPPA